MNIVQLHDRVRYWIDTVASARFESDDIDQGINVAVNEVADEKYDHSRLNHHSDAFQKTQRVRDELSDLVKKDDTNTSLTMQKLTDRVLIEAGSFPSDYKYLLAISLYISPNSYNVMPMTYDEKNVIEKNPFRRITAGPYNRLYYIESDLGIEIYHPFADSAPDIVTINYLSKPVDVFYGYEKGPADTIGTTTPIITSLSPTSYDSTEYVSGTALTTNGVLGVIDYGLAVVDFVNPNINGYLHEEIARRAALNCLLTSGNIDKYKILKAETLAT